MDDTNSNFWVPNAQQIADANVTQLMQRFGANDYDQLYKLSIERPEEYWDAIVKICGIKWSKPYEKLVDWSAGREFPKWFAGGKLNWTDTIFAWAKNPDTASRTALVMEDEAGSIRQLSYAELFDRVRHFAGGLVKLGLKKGDRVGFLMEPGIEDRKSVV